MTNYEIAAIIISVLSLGATIFFSFAVLSVSKKANEIAEENLKLQTKYVNSQFENTNTKIFSENTQIDTSTDGEK